MFELQFLKVPMFGIVNKCYVSNCTCSCQSLILFIQLHVFKKDYKISWKDYSITTIIELCHRHRFLCWIWWKMFVTVRHLSIWYPQFVYKDLQGIIWLVSLIGNCKSKWRWRTIRAASCNARCLWGKEAPLSWH